MAQKVGASWHVGWGCSRVVLIAMRNRRYAYGHTMPVSSLVTALARGAVGLSGRCGHGCSRESHRVEEYYTLT